MKILRKRDNPPKTPRELVRVILRLLAIGTIFTMASLLDPTFLYRIARLYLHYKLRGSYQRHQIQRSLWYLKRKGYVTIKQTGKLMLTDKGSKYLTSGKWFWDTVVIPKPHRWDKKWRLVIFDIPEPKRKKRDSFRRRLQALGFTRLQRSVFVYPYPCEDLIRTICDLCEVAPFVYYATADHLPNDQKLRNYFSL